jgi:hypothetical protein
MQALLHRCKQEYMKEEYKSAELVNNKASRHFELGTGDRISFIDYKQPGNKVTLIHTEIPIELERKGVATALIEKTFRYIEENDLKLVPLCPLVIAYLIRHPEWERILDEALRNK